MHITSLQNPRIKSILRLKTNPRHRRATGLFLVEGMYEIGLALAAGQVPDTLISAPDLASGALASTEGDRLTVSSAIFAKLSFRENPDGWLAVFRRPASDPRTLSLSASPLLVVAEAVEKPGNLGAILRTADAAHADGVIVCDERADIYSPNVVRASRGALLAVPVIELSSADALAYLRAHAVKVVAANPNAGTDLGQADLRGPVAIAVGTEDAGLSEVWLRNAQVQVRIPMRGKVNSLNVSVAAALLIYEALRQRGA